MVEAGNLPQSTEFKSHDFLSKVDVITRREGGRLIEAFVPIELIYQQDVPVDEAHVRDLAASIEEESGVNGGTGQLSAVLLAEIPDFKQFPIIDGFHRTPALAMLGKEKIYATIRPNSTWDEVIDLRILTATTHKSVRFPRIVEWVQEAWSRTEWSSRIDLTQAYTMRFSKQMNGRKLGLSEDEVDAIKVWINEKSSQWHISPTYTHQYLKTASFAAPDLIKQTRERPSGNKLESITPRHLGVIARSLPHRYEFQRIVAKTAVELNLTVPQTRAVAVSIADAETVEEALGRIREGYWRRISETIYGDRISERKNTSVRVDTKRPEFNPILLDSLFETELENVRLLFENAMLSGRYMPPDQDNPVVEKEVGAQIGTEADMLMDDVEKGAYPRSEQEINNIAEAVLKLEESLVRATKRRNFRTLTYEECRDIFSDVVEKFMIRVYDGRFSAEYEGQKTLRGLLKRMMQYTATDYLRKKNGRIGGKNRHRTLTFTELEADSETEERKMGIENMIGETEKGYDEVDNIDSAQNKRLLVKILPYLSREERHVLMLSVYYELSYPDIALIIGKSSYMVAMHVNAIKRKVEKLSADGKIKF